VAFMCASYIYSYRYVHTDTNIVYDMYICMHLLTCVYLCMYVCIEYTSLNWLYVSMYVRIHVSNTH
jgi:hypothetical protein